MVLDVCATLPAAPEVLRAGRRPDVRRGPPGRGPTTTGSTDRPEGQALFGIVQGGTDPALRVESAERTVALDFDGYGIGGLSVGEPRAEMLDALAATVPHLPADRPRYLMGVGDPVGMLECGGPRRRPVRLRRPHPGRPARVDVDLDRAASTCATPCTPATTPRSTPPARAPPAPAGRVATCGTCWGWASPRRWRLLSIHNLSFVLGLMDDARAAIAAGTLDRPSGRARRRSGGP